MKRIVGNYMIKNPKSVGQDLKLLELIKKFEADKVSHFLVNNSKGELTGIVSKTDLLKQSLSLNHNTSGKEYTNLSMNSITTKDIMTKDPVFVNQSDDLAYAVELLLQKEFHCLPVLKDGNTLGIVTFYDLLKAYYQEIG